MRQDGHRGDRRAGGRGARGRRSVHQGDARGHRRPAVRGPRPGGGAGPRRPRRRRTGGLRRRPRRAARRRPRRRVAAGAPVGRRRPGARGDPGRLAGARRHQRPVRQPPHRAREPAGVRDGHPPARRGRRADRRRDRDRVPGRDLAHRGLRARPVRRRGQLAAVPAARRACAGAAPTASGLQDELSYTPGRPPVQHRPADLAERPRAGPAARRPRGRLADGGRGDRPRRALDGRPRGPQRVPLRRAGRAPLDERRRATCSRSAARTSAPTWRRASTP